MPGATGRAKQWRFHPGQQFEENADGSLLVRFRAGGLREIAEHLFTWGGDVVIVGPEELRSVMADRIAAATTILRPLLSQDTLR
ncbi:WYL domain-containing protein [Altererythrobacter sp. KTW20L]|uniref:WYL domain-containing protein n=1 Tax=Altererythrobacter sp. KTW20L TaxID=2942210 RepID=UPI0020BF7CD7|nr:WYL domain-containing protein [Altererythrobacter sp. KTW20L]MCL6250033.1 WYL domain-containing protein [Altererythrobacter sp. KTW20L]